MDTLLFKWHVKKNGDTLKELAKFLNLHPHTLYMKYKEGGKKQQFTQREIQLIAKRYNLTSEDIAKIFFNEII